MPSFILGDIKENHLPSIFMKIPEYWIILWNCEVMIAQKEDKESNKSHSVVEESAVNSFLKKCELVHITHAFDCVYSSLVELWISYLSLDWKLLLVIIHCLWEGLGSIPWMFHCKYYTLVFLAVIIRILKFKTF